MSGIRYNKSKTYLLPLLSEIVGFEPKYFQYLKNTYLSDDASSHENCIYILHDFSFRNPEFTAYENKLVSNELFVELVDIGNEVLYVFKFPEEYLDEYNKYKEGRYSEFGIDAKELILEFFSEVYSGNPNAVPFLLKTKQILYKEKALREKLELDLGVTIEETAELSDGPVLEHEEIPIKEYMKKKH